MKNQKTFILFNPVKTWVGGVFYPSTIPWWDVIDAFRVIQVVHCKSDRLPTHIDEVYRLPFFAGFFR